MKVKKLQSHITKENLQLLAESERDSKCDLEKLLIWQEEYDWVDWDEFNAWWLFCERCESYAEQQCICYAR